ncbi:MFS transporter [Streptomyces sp. NPDC057509]|uniref:MFS transporter n=1 Tax=Streptomyces sp. NPDC057509 TaxID=3346152 RepID=UPI0036A158A2
MAVPAHIESPVGRSLGRVVVSSSIGTAMEWYDYFLYVAGGTLLFDKLFFPQLSPAVGTIAALGTLAVGSVSKPLGGMLFGHLGDRLGRKTVLVLTLVIMGVSTTVVGLLPTAATIGGWAPVLLVVLRFVQGLAAGGEWGGSVLLVAEHTPAHRRGFFTSMTQSGIALGFLAATGIFALFSGVLSQQQFESWGWRVPFLASVVLVAVGLYMRLKVDESPEFAALQARGKQARAPIAEVFRHHRKSALVTIGARLGESGFSSLVQLAVLVYGVDVLHVSPTMALVALMVGFAVEMVTMVGFGRLSDRVGRRPVYILGATAAAVLAFPLIWMLGSDNGLLLILAVSLAFGTGHAGMIGVVPSFFTELFPADLRYSGMSVNLISGGITAVFPLAVSALILWSGGSLWPLAGLLVVIALTGLASVYWAEETHHLDRADGTHPEQAHALAADTHS